MSFVLRIKSLHCKNEYAKIRNTSSQEHSAHWFNVVTLKREKTMGKQSFIIQWMYNTRDYNTSIECINHTGLLASAVTHTTMAPLSLSLTRAHTLSVLHTLTHSLFVLSVFILIHCMGYLQMSPPLHIIIIIAIIIIIELLNNHLTIFDSSIAGFRNSQIFP